MTKPNQTNHEPGLNIAIFADSVPIAEHLSEWIDYNYPNFNCKICNKENSQLDNYDPQIIIFDFGLSLEDDLRNIYKIRQHFPNSSVVAMTFLGHDKIEKEIQDKDIILIFPKWDIIDELPAIIKSRVNLKNKKVAV
mgnify:CR=1 FL=1